jgi:ABC-2 type transport system permease protein
MRSHVTIRIQDRDPLIVDVEHDESVAPLVSRLISEGAQIEEVRRADASLEDVFLHLVRSSGQQQPELPRTLDAAPAVAKSPQRPIFGDILTIMRKEWREIVSASGPVSTTKMNLIVLTAMLIFCAVIAALMPADVTLRPGVLVVTMVAYIVVLTSICDSFPGERERHTIETLLASAIPDEALLLGKILGSVIYSWAFVVLILVTILIGANIRNFPAMYPASILIAALIATPLLLLLFSTAGVLLCMRLPTVRAAQARVTGATLAFFIAGVIFSKFMPDGWRQQVSAMMSNESSRLSAVATQVVALVVLNVTLLVFAMMRFRRSRLI